MCRLFQQVTAEDRWRRLKKSKHLAVEKLKLLAREEASPSSSERRSPSPSLLREALRRKRMDIKGEVRFFRGGGGTVERNGFGFAGGGTYERD